MFMEYEIGYLDNRHKRLSSDDYDELIDDVLRKEQINEYDDFDSKTETVRLGISD